MHEPGIQILLFVALALVLGAATRHLLKGTPIPYSVALLVIGLGLGTADRTGLLASVSSLLDHAIDLVANIDPHLILFLFLPTLIFESAFAMEVHLFRRTFSQIAILAVPGLILCTLATALLARVAFPWDWSWGVALMFGALISATDPVAVVALLKEQSSRKRLETLIEGESLLNDGTAIVLFTLFYGMAVAGSSGEFSLLGTVFQFTWVVALGLFIGVALGIVALVWIGRVFNDEMIEITVTVAVAYLVFFIAEGMFHVSGVIGIVTLALLFASVGRTRISPEVGGFLHHFWELMAYIANTVIFLLVGIVIADRVRVDSVELWLVLGALYVCLFLIRGGAITLFNPILKRIGIGITREKSIVLTWGGLRGAVALALALVVAQDPDMPAGVGDTVLFLCAGIVVLTILVNGMTMPMVFRWLGLDRLPASKQATIDKARVSIREDLEKLLPELKGNQFLQMADWEHIRNNTELSALPPDSALDEAQDKDYETAYRRRLLEAERKSYWVQYQQGLLSGVAVQKLVEAVEHALDGEPQVGPRAELYGLWRTPAWLAWALHSGLFRNLAISYSFDRLALGYDAARGFIIAQDEISRYVDQLAPSEGAAARVRGEILQNKRDTFVRVEELRQSFPEILAGLETQAATRVLLNRERAVIQRLVGAGVLDKPEAERLVEGVEHKMKELRQLPLDVPKVNPEEMLSRVEWVARLPGDGHKALAKLSEVRIHASDEDLIRAGQSQPGVFVISRGSVEVLSPDGETVEEVLGAGAVLGADSLVEGRHARSVRANTPIEAVWLRGNGLKSALGQYPQIPELVRAAVVAREIPPEEDAPAV